MSRKPPPPPSLFGGAKPKAAVSDGSAIAARVVKLQEQGRSDAWLIEIATRLRTLEDEVARLKARPIHPAQTAESFAQRLVDVVTSVPKRFPEDGK